MGSNISEDDFAGALKNTRVAVAGLGLMGGSLALALRGHCRELIGLDRDPRTLTLALERGVVDRAGLLDGRARPDWSQVDPGRLLPEADLVILATPVNTILRLLMDLPDMHPGSPVVLDLGSTKTEIVRAMQNLPERFDPIGGHPMCGKEKSSLDAAEARIYSGAPFALAVLPRTTPRARVLAEDLVNAVGAHPLWIEPERHDAWVAATSHLPYLVANALAASTPFNVAELIGPGFRSTTRVAGTSSDMMLDVLTTNRDNILEALGRFRTHLDALETLLVESNLPELQARLDGGSDAYRRLVEAAAVSVDTAAEATACQDSDPGGKP
jgi:prephenate dehydrogenase